MPVVSELPKGLEEHDFQRNFREKLLGVKTLPIGFSPSRPPKTRSQEDRATVKISFPNKVVKTYRVFFSDTLEQAIKHVYLNKSIVDDLKIAERISTAEAEIKEKQEQLNLLQSRLGCLYFLQLSDTAMGTSEACMWVTI